MGQGTVARIDRAALREALALLDTLPEGFELGIWRTPDGEPARDPRTGRLLPLTVPQVRAALLDGTTDPHDAIIGLKLMRWALSGAPVSEIGQST